MNNIPLNQKPNPSDVDRHEMMRDTLIGEGRLEDLENIINLLSPPPDITNIAPLESLKKYKIGIIGAGLAGLAAAFELRKLGANVTILEAEKDRVGGRVYTHYFDEEEGLYGEFGAERFPVSHETTWHYFNLFGLKTVSMTPIPRNNITYVHNTRLRPTDSVENLLYPKYDLTKAEANIPWPALRKYAFNTDLLRLSPEVRKELLMILPEYDREIEGYMNMSIRDGLESLGLSQGAINLISGMSPGTGATLDASYASLLQDEYTFDFRNLYQLEGGNVNLPLAFYHSFCQEDDCKLYNIRKEYLGSVSYRPGCTVCSIRKSSNNRVTLAYMEDNKHMVEEFDYCICTIPFSALRTVEIKPYFSNMKMQAILEFNYSNALKTLYLCNKRFWEENTYYGNITGGVSFTDLPIQSILYPVDHNICLKRGTCSAESPGVLVACYNLAQNSTRVGGLSEASREALIENNVEEVHGLPRGYLEGVIDDQKSVQWNTEPFHRGAFAFDLPGQRNLFLYQMQQAEYDGKVFFAGEHVSTKQGWVQGALQSGMTAANQIAYEVAVNGSKITE